MARQRAGTNEKLKKKKKDIPKNIEDTNQSFPINRKNERVQQSKDFSSLNGNVSKVYSDPSHPAGFGSLRQLEDATGESLKDIKKWSLKQDTYTLHKTITSKYNRNNIVTTF